MSELSELSAAKTRESEFQGMNCMKLSVSFNPHFISTHNSHFRTTGALVPGSQRTDRVGCSRRCPIGCIFTRHCNVSVVEDWIVLVVNFRLCHKSSVLFQKNRQPTINRTKSPHMSLKILKQESGVSLIPISVKLFRCIKITNPTVFTNFGVSQGSAKRPKNFLFYWKPPWPLHTVILTYDSLAAWYNPK